MPENSICILRMTRRAADVLANALTTRMFFADLYSGS